MGGRRECPNCHQLVRVGIPDRLTFKNMVIFVILIMAFLILLGAYMEVLK